MAASGVTCSDGWVDGRVDLSLRQTQSACLPPLPDHVMYVVTLIANEQVVRVDTSRVVASWAVMEDELTGRDCPMLYFVRKSMSNYSRPTLPIGHLSITASVG